MESIIDQIFYSVIGFKDKEKMATFSKDGYKRKENAQMVAKNLIKKGYEEVNIRLEQVWYRNNNNEFSSSWIIETYNPNECLIN